MADITKITVGSTTYNIKDANAEKSSNKVTSISSGSTDTQYPSALAVKTYVDEKGFDPSSMPAVSDPVVLNQTQSDWNQSDSNAVDYIKNKPTIPAAQVQSDWNQSNTGSVDYIKNKPTVPTVASSIASGQTGYTTGEQVYNYAYTKPSGGIPKTDLASAVQTSLGKADTALQSHQDISGKENTTNKVTSLSSSSTDTQYPSAKCVYNLVGNVETLLAAL